MIQKTPPLSRATANFFFSHNTFFQTNNKLPMSTPESISLPDAPSDGITQLSYLPSNSSLLASTSWDGSLRIHNTSSKTLVTNQALASGPILSLATPSNSSSSSVWTGGLDGSVKQFHIESSTVELIGLHSSTTSTDDASPSEIACSCLAPLFHSDTTVASAGWDSCAYLWDARVSNAAKESGPGGMSRAAVATIPLKDKAYAMDVDPSSETRLVLSLAGRHTVFMDVRKLDTPTQSMEANIVLERESSLKYQSRVIKFFPDGSGIATGSIEGRVGIEFLTELGVTSPNHPTAKKYAFKCHRVGDTVYPVNAIAFHPILGTFATGGCDGTVVTWDGGNKKKLVTLASCATSVAALAFNGDGTEIAIASSYTYEDGERDHPRDEILVRKVLESEVRPKSK